MIGLSRKRFISSISKADEPKNRLGGTISASLSALQQGIKIHRVHDVLEINQSIKWLTNKSQIDTHCLMHCVLNYTTSIENANLDPNRPS